MQRGAAAGAVFLDQPLARRVHCLVPSPQAIFGTDMIENATPNPVSPPTGDVPQRLLDEVATLIVTVLDLDVVPSEIAPDAPLYGDGLGLDSIDILEVALEVSKQYGFQLRSDNGDSFRMFRSLRSLADHVWRNKAA